MPNVFNSTRLAYLNELDADPDVQAAISSTRDWIDAKDSDGSWAPEVLAVAESGDTGMNSIVLYKHACVYDDEKIIIELNDRGNYSADSGSSTIFFFNTKHSMMLFINRYGGAESIADNPDSINKIKTWISEYLDSPGAHDVTVPMSDILNTKTASIKLAYLEDLDADPSVRLIVMRNPPHGWDEEAITATGFFKMMRPGPNNTLERSRIWADEPFRYGYSYIDGPGLYVEVKKTITPIKGANGKTVPANPGTNSLEPADETTIWDGVTKTLLFCWQDLDKLMPESRAKYLKALVKWLDGPRKNGSSYFEAV